MSIRWKQVVVEPDLQNWTLPDLRHKVVSGGEAVNAHRISFNGLLKLGFVEYHPRDVLCFCETCDAGASHWKKKSVKIAWCRFCKRGWNI